MCGIAGVVDLGGHRPVPAGVLDAMAEALFHRGPDEGGFLERPGVGLVSRRLSIVGLHDGRQPIANEDGTVSVVLNGELFDYPELRPELERRGHRFATCCDTELLPHLYEEYGEGLFTRLRGQFAFALWDERRRLLLLARDRFGICPLYWTRQGQWLLFASEIKALLASGMVEARPDPRGINHLFTFFALPGPGTCFAGVQTLLPGHYLRVALDRAGGRPAPVQDHVYWEIDFPDHGDERDDTAGRLVDEFEGVLSRAVARRLRADVPVVAYLSGGVDSSVVTALACRLRGEPLPTFTVRVTTPGLDESTAAGVVARHLGCRPVQVAYGPAENLGTYPGLIRAAEGPVLDTACAALLLLAREVHAQGYKVALTGEGADEWLAGYPWFKAHRLLGWLDAVPGVPLGDLLRRAYLRLTGVPSFPWALARRNREALGGPNAWFNLYSLVSLAKLRLFSQPMLELAAGTVPYDDLGLNRSRMGRWHPFHRSLYVGARVMLPGLLLLAKGDRVAMHSSVETRYPFLDEEVFHFLAGLHPRWKLRGLRDKYLLRLLAGRLLPAEVARRPKAMFRAPLDSFHAERQPAYLDQLLSRQSLRRSGYFEPAAVQHWRQAFRQFRRGSLQRTSLELGLVGVVATQLWHHTFIDGGLADLPSLVPARRPVRTAS
jgi:asparagine synthase (glutamine-hydrolysing)